MNIGSILITSAAVVGGAAALIAFLRTPDDQKFRIRRLTLEEQLATLPPEAEGVILKGDWRRAVQQDKLGWMAVLVLGPLAIWWLCSDQDTCAMMLGLRRAQIALLLFFYVLPGLMLITSLFAFRNGLLLLKGSHWPPLDSVPFKDTISKKGRWGRLRGVLICLLPALIVGWTVTNHFTFAAATREQAPEGLFAAFGHRCEKPPPTPPAP